MRTQCSFILLLASIALFAGCRQIDYTTPARYQKGLVICLGGAGGASIEVNRLRKGLYKGGVEYALEQFRWSRGNLLKDQTDLQENRRRAGQLARRIEAYRCDYPDRPLYLIGLSAGTGILVWSLEALQPGYCVDGAVLIASSLDSGYDLTGALEHTTIWMHSFYSLTDPVLGVGVTFAGTVDRRQGPSGGMVGFKPPEDSNEHTRDLYKRKFTQHPWRPADVFRGHIGGHHGASNPAFVSKRIAPLMIPEPARSP